VCAERLPELLLDASLVWIPLRRLALLRLALQPAADELLGLAHAELPFGDDSQGFGLVRAGGETEQGAGVPLGNVVAEQGILHRFGRVKQAQGVRDGDPRAADAAGQLGLRDAELLDQLLEGFASSRGSGRLGRCSRPAPAPASPEGGVLDDRGHALEPGALGGTPAPLPGDQVVAIRLFRRRDDERWTMPWVRIDAVSSSRWWRSMCERGCQGFGEIAATGSSAAPAADDGVAVRSGGASSGCLAGISASSPRPRPPLRGERDWRLPVCGAIGGHDGAELRTSGQVSRLAWETVQAYPSLASSDPARCSE